MPTTFHHSLIPHFQTMARSGWRGGKKLYFEMVPSPYDNFVTGNPNAGTVDEIADSFDPGLDGGGYFEDFVSDGNNGDELYLSASATKYFACAPAQEFFILIRFGLPTITDIRFFTGTCPYGEQTYVNDNDNPYAATGVINMAGLQFSTGRGDTNFQFVRTNVDEETLTLTDTGVAPSTSTIYQLEMEYSNGGASLRGRLSDHTGAILMADTTVTDDLPLAPGIMEPFVGLKELAAAVKKFRFYRMELWA